MKTTLLWALGGLIFGGIIHIFSVLWIPMTAEKDSWTQLARLGPVNAFHRFPPAREGETTLPDMDPSLRYAVCRYDLSGGLLQITARVPPVYWSVTLYDRRGVNYYALNDRLVAGREITLWVATPRQLLAVAPQSAEGSISDERLLIGAPAEIGFAVLRALVPGPSHETVVAEALDATRCAVVGPRGAANPGAG